MKLKPVLINQEFQDPVLMTPIPQMAESLVFDLGYCFRFKIRDIQRISRIFISHTHIDHFAGFDHILRLSIDRDKTMEVYGPPGIIGNVEGKLAGYVWNLAGGVFLNFKVFEIHRDRILTKTFRGNDGYKNPSEPEEFEWNEDKPICTDENYKIHTAFLDHRMPVLGYRIEAAPSFNADSAKMKEMELSPGPWVGKLKEAVSEKEINPDAEIDVNGVNMNLKKLADQLIAESPGTRIAYVVDTIFNKKTAPAIKRLAKDADLFFCECAYLTSERELARENYHLTARQAARSALEAGAKTLIPFHFSKRYDGQYDKLYEEAKAVFPSVSKAPKYLDN